MSGQDSTFFFDIQHQGINSTWRTDKVRLYTVALIDWANPNQIIEFVLYYMRKENTMQNVTMPVPMGGI